MMSMPCATRLRSRCAFKQGQCTDTRPPARLHKHLPFRPVPCRRAQPPASPDPAPSDDQQPPAPSSPNPAAAQQSQTVLLQLNPIQYLFNVLQPKEPTRLEIAGSLVVWLCTTALQAVVLLLYVTFWWNLTAAVWERTCSAWSLAIPVGVVVFNEWAVLKVLVACYFATALGAWPLLIGKLVIDAIHAAHAHDLRSFPRSIRVLAAVLGRNLRAPVLANYTWLQYTQQELSGFEPITGPLSDNTDTTVFKWQSLWDIVWMVGVLWFLIAHLVIYEANWGDLFKGTGFTYARLGTWHMPEFPQFWKPTVGGPAVQVISHGIPNLWGPFPVT